jgi:hypothetical protein
MVKLSLVFPVELRSECHEILIHAHQIQNNLNWILTAELGIKIAAQSVQAPSSLPREAVLQEARCGCIHDVNSVI